MIIKHDQIMNILTKMLLEHFAQGYVLSSEEMFISSDWRNFVMIEKESETLILGITKPREKIAYLRVERRKANFEWEIVSSETFYVIEDDYNPRNVVAIYTDSENEFERIQSVRYKRQDEKWRNSFLKEQNEEYLTGYSAAVKAVEIAKKRKGYKRVKIEDVTYIRRARNSAKGRIVYKIDFKNKESIYIG